MTRKKGLRNELIILLVFNHGAAKVANRTGLTRNPQGWRVGISGIQPVWLAV